MIVIAVLAFSGSGLGCDMDSLSAAAPSSCTDFGSQCQLGGGPLGVCDHHVCSEDEAPPCFVCTPQH